MIEEGRVAGLEINIRVYDTEEELIAGLRRHEADACTCMVKRFAPLVFAHARRMVGDADEAEEVLQMTFIKACEKIDSFAGRSALGTWLYRIATNEALIALRELQGLSTEETASALGIGQSAVKVRLHRARLRLRELLSAYFAEEAEGGDA
jgi:DNA-directed RNA polymerase specialized sigma24 family protein